MKKLELFRNNNIKSSINNENANDNCKINTDPFGSWTGVNTEDIFDKPVQDVDDL